MSGKTIVIAVLGVACVCCLFAHRRVIKAAIKGEEMPKAPSWHFWVSPDKRRSE